MFHFNKKYFFIAVAIFFVEVFIALFIKDRIIRPFIGDFLVVILLYCFARSFWKTTARNAAIAVLIFSFAVEIGQYFKLVELLGLKGNRFAEIVIGTSFDWMDLVAYTTGVGLAFFLDKKYFDPAN